MKTAQHILNEIDALLIQAGFHQKTTEAKVKKLIQEKRLDKGEIKYYKEAIENVQKALDYLREI